MQLPENIDPIYFHRHYRLDFALWRAAVVELCAKYSFNCSDVSIFTGGSNLVAAVDNSRVVKIFPPFHKHQWDSERSALPHFQDRLPVQVPKLLAEGIRDDKWPYLILEKLPGVLLQDCWPSLSARDKARLMEDIGATIAAAHRVPVGDLAGLPPRWDAFIRGQISDCRRRHVEFGAPEWLLNDLGDFLAEAFKPTCTREHVVLTGEYTPSNLLMTRNADEWHFAGMFDFGDAMVGDPEYDLLGPSLFCCGGDPTLIAALFSGYAGRASYPTRDVRMRLMALAVLHRYANFDYQLRIPAWRERVCSLQSLAELIWPARN